MQSQRSKKSAILFEVLLDAEELSELVQIDEVLLKRLIQHCSKHFAKVYYFLANYKQIMEVHSRLVRSTTSVNISLHFALLFTHDLLSEKQHAYAKAILKQTEQYLPLADCDSLLLSACLSNLALLHLRSARPRKALACCLNAIALMEDHLARLRELKNRRRMTEDGVIFVNLLLIAKRSLARILKGHINDPQIYKQLLSMINRLGYNFSVKYLGASSIFTAKFELHPDSIDLPVFDESMISSKPARDDFEERLAGELSNIYHILKEMKLEPEVYYIKQHLVEARESHEASIQVIEELPSMEPEPEPERSLAHVEHIIVDEWDVELSLLVSKQLGPEREFQFLGIMQFRLTKGRRTREKTVSEDNVFKIIHALNTYDILPYEMGLQRLTCPEFTKRVLMAFLEVTQDGDLRILPRARPILSPFQLTFCGQRSFILVNHVRFRRFRVAICPFDSCETLYLEVEFRHKQTDSLFKLVEFQQEFIADCSRKHHPSEKFTEQYSYAPMKKIQILNSEFAGKINRLLREFEVFLTEQEEYRMSEMTTVVNFSENYIYYQYTEFKEGIGQFHLLKYRSNANHTELSCKNLFSTHSPNGIEQARGTATYSPQQFQRDFSVPLKAVRRHLPAFCELILQKFSLKIYPSPLLEEEEDLYEQNAIAEVPITSKCYSRRFLPFEDYLLPVTIEVVAVNNEKPIGIRVTAYEPLKGTHSGLFIHVTSEYWERPAAREEAGGGEQEGGGGRVKRSTEDYNFKKFYFLTVWMEEEGFELIFDRLQIVNRALQLRGANSKLIRLDQLLLRESTPY